jgi:hypothetical protein
MSIPLSLFLRRIRATSTSKRGAWIVLSGYAASLVATFIFGALVDDGFGVAFVPLFLITLPFSYFVPSWVVNILGTSRLSASIVALYMNFALLVVICGGLNSVILFWVIGKISNSAEPDSILKK